MTVHSSDIAGALSVIQLLSRQRSAVIYDGSEFSVVLNRLALLEQHVLMEVTSVGEAPGYLLIQWGWVVFACCGSFTGQTAADHLTVMARGGVLRLFVLGEGTAALAFASVRAETDPHHDHDHSSITARLAQLTERQFSGVVAVRARNRVNIWQMKAGRVLVQQELPEAGNFGPFVQYVWEDQKLPHLTVAQAEHAPKSSEAEEAFATTAPHPVSSTATPLPESGSMVWNRFQQVAEAHLGEAAARLCALAYLQHGAKVGPPLCEALGLQVDRIAGRSAGQEFRRHVAPAPSSLEALS